MTTKTVNGTDSNDTVTIADSSPAPGFDVNLNAVVTGPFNDDTLIVNGKFGSDTINLAGLTAASNVTSVTVSGGGNDDNLTGSALADTFLVNGTGEGLDIYNGGLGDDVIKAQVAGTNIGLKGNFLPANGIEEISANGFANVNVIGDDNANTLDFSGTALTGVTVDGRFGNDIITGNGDANTIRGGGNDDTLNGGAGDDTFLVNGTGEGLDIYDGGAGTDAIKAQVAGTNIGLKGNFLPANGIEEISANGFANVNVIGDDGANTLDFSGTALTGVTVDGRFGNDIITGNGDANTIRGGGNDDTLNGGAGDDTFLVNGTGEGLDIYDGGAGTDAIKAQVAGTNIGLKGNFLPANGIEEISANGFANVNVIGDDNANTLDFSGTALTGVTVDGRFGSDIITGNGDANTIRGGGNDDTLNGGAGDDTFLVNGTGEGLDIYDGGAGTDAIKAQVAGTNIGLKGNFLPANGIEEISANGFANVNVIGDDNANILDFSGTALTGVTVDGRFGNDIITGNGDANTIRGGGNDDTLNGGAGDDTFLVNGTGEGLDIYDGGAGTDAIKAQVAGTNIGLKGNFLPANGIEEISANGFANVNVIGDDNGNTLDFSTTTLTNVTVDGRFGNDIITGNGDANTIRGGGNDDTLNGGAGDDTFLVNGTGEGLDIYDGGAGTDAIKAQVAGTNIGLKGNFLPVNGIEEISANGFANVNVIGDDNGNTLDFSGTALTGVTVDGRFGNDIITGNGDANTIRGGGNDDTLNGGAGDDTFLVNGTGEGLDIYNGGLGDDVIKAQVAGTNIGLKGNFTSTNSIKEISANGFLNVNVIGDDTGTTLDFSGTTLTNVTVDGRFGNDTITGNTAANTLRGGEGADTMRGSAGDDTLFGDGGNDTFTVVGGGDGLDTVNGGAGNDTWLGIGGADVFYVTSGLGNLISVENINGGTSTDQIIATAGDDILDFSTGPTLTSIEEILGGAGNDTITGNADSNTIRGGTGIDSLVGGNGDDTFTVVGGGDGVDTVVDGGNGNDTWLGIGGADVFYVTSGLGNLISVENINGGTSTDQIIATAGDDVLNFSIGPTLTSIEEILGGAGNDTITGNADSNTIRGGAGSDSLVGGNGDDTFTVVGGGDGVDTVVDGGDGNDTWLGIGGADVFYVTSGLSNLISVENINGGTSTDQIVATAGDDFLDFSIGPTLTSIEEILGGAGNDTITGNADSNTIRGGTGSDSLVGGNGDDTFTVVGGGDGVDTVVDGGDGNDTWLGIGGADVFYVTSGLSNLISVENINGGTSTDQIVATAGDDFLDFSIGPTLTSIEEINSGNGNDTITVSDTFVTNYRGSAGTDTFVVTTTSAESTILDFDDLGDDRIDLSSFGLSSAQLQALTAQVGSDIRIDLTAANGNGGAGTGDIILVGTTLASLDFAGTTDFIL